MCAVSIDLDKITDIKIEDTLFGHNLEHTRSAVYQGLSAQLLRNRKFAGKPAAHFGEPAEWYRVGAESVFITLDPQDAYVKHDEKEGRHFIGNNEINSLIIQNPLPNQKAGIGQRDLALKGGAEYKARIIASVRGDDLPLKVTLTIASRDGAVYKEKTFNIESGIWCTSEFTFTAPAGNVNASFEVSFSQKAELKLGAASLLPVDSFHGMRKDVVVMMKNIGIALLRWPGGNFSGEYRWKDGLLDVDQRAPLFSYTPVETQPHSGGYDFHEIGIDEFIALCREIGAEPYLTINLAWDSPEESAQWVEYCNGGASTGGGKRRVERGHAEPYQVKYWSLGNEFGYGHMEGLNTPEAYAEKARSCVRAMKKVDPSIRFFSSGPYGPHRDPAPWTKQGLPLLAKEVSYLSYHAYEWHFVHGVDFVTDKGLKKSYEDITSSPVAWLEDIKKLRAFLDAQGEDIRKIAVSFDEWNVFFAWYHDPCVIEGMFTALMLEMFCKEYKALNMPVCMYFQPVNEGAIMIHPFKSELTANGQVFTLMKKHRRGLLADVNSSDKDIHCLVTVDQGKGGVTLTIINCSYDRVISCVLCKECGGVQNAVLLDGSGPILHGVKFIQRDGFTIKNAAGEFVIPPRSILQLECGLETPL
jgi:alpha-N-arabinofuranosidase